MSSKGYIKLWDDDDDEKRPLIISDDYVGLTPCEEKAMLLAQAEAKRRLFLSKLLDFFCIGPVRRETQTPGVLVRPMQLNAGGQNASAVTVYPGHFRKPAAAPDHKRHILWKYTVRSSYYPVRHQCLGSKTTPPDWIAWVTINFHNPDVFAKTRMPWRENLDSVSVDKIGIDNSPVEFKLPHRVEIFRRNVQLRWIADDAGGGGCPGSGWTVRISFWSRDRSLVMGDLADNVEEMINPKTLVHVNAWLSADPKDLLASPSRFYFKCVKSTRHSERKRLSATVPFFDLKALAGDEAVDRALNLAKQPSSLKRRCTSKNDVDKFALKKLVEERYEEQFFG